MRIVVSMLMVAALSVVGGARADAAGSCPDQVETWGITVGTAFLEDGVVTCVYNGPSNGYQVETRFPTYTSTSPNVVFIGGGGTLVCNYEPYYGDPDNRTCVYAGGFGFTAVAPYDQASQMVAPAVCTENDEDVYGSDCYTVYTIASYDGPGGPTMGIRAVVGVCHSTPNGAIWCESVAGVDEDLHDEWRALAELIHVT